MPNNLWLAILSSLIVLVPAREREDSSLISTLKDVKKAYSVLHVIDDQEEQLHLYVADKDQEEIRPFLGQCIKTCESLGGQTYSNSTLSTHMQNYLDQTIKNYQTLNKLQPGQQGFIKKFDAHNTQRRNIADFLVTTFDLSHFVHLTEETYWKTVDKKNYIRSARYSAYVELKKHNIPQALSLLDSIYRVTPDFQEKTIYQLELADEYEKNRNTLSNGTNLAIKTYQSILDKKQYCLYLYEAWLKWRVVSQQYSGLSKSSDIPNNHYDEVRDQVANVILAHIQQNEKDEMAINQFFVITTHDIIFRFGEYPYGNQNTVEYHEIFQ
ncbi:MAG TPA: hypothetical protein VKU83_03425 [Puia sp.]|nr:hypothetical protein [Puia sp.]